MEQMNQDLPSGIPAVQPRGEPALRSERTTEGYMVGYGDKGIDELSLEHLVSQSQTLLKIRDTNPDLEYRFVNDDPGRIPHMELKHYRVVLDTNDQLLASSHEAGSVRKLRAGTSRHGEDRNMILMSRPKTLRKKRDIIEANLHKKDMKGIINDPSLGVEASDQDEKAFSIGASFEETAN